MFTMAKCLQGLELFILSKGGSGYRSSSHNQVLVYKDFWFPVFDAFTLALSSVEEVQLYAPCHLPSCQFFSRMVNLKKLLWTISGFCVELQREDGTFFWQCYMSDAGGNINGEDVRSMVDHAMEMAFSDFVKTPRLTLL
jgi:hypothetical protein